METVVAIGDLHGHYPALEKLLTGLQNKYALFSELDLSNNTLPLRNDASLVFLGDYIDRGTQGRKILELVMAAEQSNQNVHALMGNHELMLLAALGDARKIRDKNMPDEFYGVTPHGQNGGFQFLKEFGIGHDRPIDSFCTNLHRDAQLGSWLRSLDPYAKIQVGEKNLFFCHAGIPTSIPDKEAMYAFRDDFSAHMKQDSYTLHEDKYLRHPLVGKEGLFWIREKFFHKPRLELEAHLRDLKVDHVVIGHTPQMNGKILNVHNLIFNIDVAMCPAYGENTPAALVVRKEGITGFYVPDVEEKLLDF